MDKKKKTKTKKILLFSGIVISLFALIFYKRPQTAPVTEKSFLHRESTSTVTPTFTEDSVPDINFDEAKRLYTSPVLYNTQESDAFVRYKFSVNVPSEWIPSSFDPRSTVTFTKDAEVLEFVIAPAAAECVYEEESDEGLLMDSYAEAILLDQTVRVSRQVPVEGEEEWFTICSKKEDSYVTFAFADQYILGRAPEGTSASDFASVDVATLLSSLEIEVIETR